MPISKKFVPHTEYTKFPVEEMIKRAKSFYDEMKQRRTVRAFSNKPVPRKVIEDCIKTAGTAPNGANMQPWHFVVVENASVKTKIRKAAEKEEKEFYEHRASREWLEALAPLGTDESKPFIEEASSLIAIFSESYSINESGSRVRNYYVKESVGIASGMLITALHHAGCVCLTHTPSPMGFLNNILDRPQNEKPFLLLVTGFPADDVTVPDITKKSLDEIATFM